MTFTVFQNARVVDPSRGIDETGAVIVEGKKIVAAGFSFSEIAVVRYDSDGTLDGSFGGTGIVTTSVAAVNDAATSIALQGDGKIVVAGHS